MMNRREFLQSTAVAAASGYVLLHMRAAHADLPKRPYLTWQNDPCTTMTVTFQTATAPKGVVVHYDTEPRGGEAGRHSFHAAGATTRVGGLADGRSVNTAELAGLRPGTRHYFVFEDETGRASSEYCFDTIPDDGRPVTFVIGGDMGAGPRMRKLTDLAARQDPLFCVVGGDIHYENGDIREFQAVDDWLNMMAESLVGKGGRIVPMVLAIGNHEVSKDVAESEPGERRAPFYYGFYPQGGKSHFSRRFGPNLAIVCLDSEHIVPVEAQTEWLKNTLQSYADVPFVCPVYHVPMYPAHREFAGNVSMKERSLWQPLFEKHHVRVCFENHDHLFKRTKPLLNSEENPDGIVYLGDGCFGRDPREVNEGNRWYLEKASQTAHFWTVTAEKGGITCVATDEDGNEIDRWSKSL
jgi:hypothetical protein